MHQHTTYIFILVLGILLGGGSILLFSDKQVSPEILPQVIQETITEATIEHFVADNIPLPPEHTFQDIFLQSTSDISTQTTEFPLTSQGKEIITSIREQHNPTRLIPHEKNNLSLCAGYLYELSRALRGNEGPDKFGMLDPETRQVADARVLPYGYWYRGGAVPYDLGDTYGKQLKRNPNAYTSLIDTTQLLKLFAHAFHRDNLLSDIGFLYTNTAYTHMLGQYGNYNSHVAKNMGLSTFSFTVTEADAPSHNRMILGKTLGCDATMRDRLEPLFAQYRFTINGSPAFYQAGGIIWRKKDTNYEKYQLEPLDIISFKDIILAHFFEDEQVDSLFQLTCQGKLAPINIMNINSKFIEKI